MTPNAPDKSFQNTAQFQTIVNTYRATLSTRQRGTDEALQNMVIQQRISSFDLSGDILQTAEEIDRPVNHIIIKEEELEDVDFVIPCKDYDRVFKRPKGYLWYPKSQKMLENRLKLLEKMKRTPFIWASQYQQDPSDTGMALVPITYFNWYKEEIQDLPIVATFITCDLAFKENETNDRSCICFWGLANNGDLYLLDILFDRYRAEDLPEMLIEFYNKHAITDFVRKSKDLCERPEHESVFCFTFLIEEERNETLIPYLKNKIQGIKVLSRKANSSKTIRLNKALPVIATKIIYLPAVRHFKEVNTIKEELRAITAETFEAKETHNDFLDNALDAVNEGRQSAIRMLVRLERVKNDLY